MKKGNNQRISSQISALILAGVISISSLTSGCTYNKNNNGLLKGTKLENARVITFADSSCDIATRFSLSSCSYDHYHSIITGDYYTGHFKDVNHSTHGPKYTVYDIVDDYSIIYYLTNEEFKKAYKHELTDDDISAIIRRIILGVTEENEDIIKTSGICR